MRIRRGMFNQLKQNAASVLGVDEVDLRAAGTESWCIIEHPYAATTQGRGCGPDIRNSVSHVVQARSASHQKVVEHRVLGQRHHELKLGSPRSGLPGSQHDLGHLLVEVFLAMHHLEPEQVNVEADRFLQISDRDTYMIKTEQT